MPLLRDQIIGAWELISFSAHLPDNESDKVYPMGADAQGIIMYTPDGYMSAQLQASENLESFSKYMAYTGQFYLDEEGDKYGPILLHHMRNSNIQNMVGDTQRRLVQIVDENDGKYLVLGVKGTMSIRGEERVVRVRWRRLKENREESVSKVRL